jgi:hypothetical protein
MNRRFFLKSSGLAAGATPVPVAVQGMAKQLDASRRYLPRIVPINQGWLFSPSVRPGDTEAHFNPQPISIHVTPAVPELA